jgi:prepilin-type N-terminal cleavage/methylation domain-containing protein
MLSRLRDQEGFTLIELMVAITLGMLVLFALTSLIDTGGRARARLSDKTETVQRMRNGMDRITRVLRTQVCANTATPPIISGSASSVTFYSDVSGTTQNSAFRPRKVELSYSTDDGGSVVQKTWDPTNTASPWTYNTSPSQTSTLIDYVAADSSGSSSIFEYYAFDALTTELALPLNGTLSGTTVPANSVAKVSKINVTLRARPQSGNTTATRSTQMTNTVYTRNADFSGGDNVGRTWGPRCG